MMRPLRLPAILILLAASSSLRTAAQDYAPFNPDSRKLFASTPGYLRTFSIAFDSTTTDGSTTTYHNYKTISDTFVPSNCPWWGGPECRKQDQPTWAGYRIEADAQGVHTFFNTWNEPINLAFSTLPGQTLMYADGDEQFLLNYEGEFPATVMGQAENVRRWTIWHQDLGGNSISSPLNNALVEVGETIGLIHSFRVDSFPQVLQPVELVGQSEPPLGLHTITRADAYDFQAGEAVQVHDQAYYSMGPPWMNHNLYIKHNFLTRTDTPTEVSYDVEVTTFDVVAGTEEVTTTTLSYSKTEVIATIPFDRFDGTAPTLGMVDYCGTPRWTFITYRNTGLGYCPEENCWGPYDTNGPPPMGDSTFVLGLGVYHSSEIITSPTGHGMNTQVVYYLKNGVECMDEVIMSTGDAVHAADELIIAPNPANEAFTFRAPQRIAALDVVDARGHIVSSMGASMGTGTLQTAGWPAGLYMLRFTLEDGRTLCRRMAVAR